MDLRPGFSAGPRCRSTDTAAATGAPARRRLPRRAASDGASLRGAVDSASHAGGLVEGARPPPEQQHPPHRPPQLQPPSAAGTATRLSAALELLAVQGSLSGVHLVPGRLLQQQDAARGGLGGGPAGAAPAVVMASSAARGAKAQMEDTHVLAALDPAGGAQPFTGEVLAPHQVSMAGVFDGHAGSATAMYAAQRLPQLLHSALTQQKLYSCAQPGGQCDALAQGALASSFRGFDRWWNNARTDPTLTRHGWDESGATAVVGVVAGSTLFVANAGDSSALLMRGASLQRLSVEHRPDRNSAEADRVVGAGGRLVARAPGAPLRVVGSSSQTRYRGTMVTRSLGDFAWKHPQPLLTPDPHLAAVRLQPGEDSLLLLLSDGVTDVLGDAQLLDLALGAVERARTEGRGPQQAAQSVSDAVIAAALAGNTRDNVTAVAMLVDWTHGARGGA